MHWLLKLMQKRYFFYIVLPLAFVAAAILLVCIYTFPFYEASQVTSESTSTANPIVETVSSAPTTPQPLASTPVVSTPTDSNLKTVVINGQNIHVLIADTPALQQRGLGGRSGLPLGEGMLFIFNTDGQYAFWMKDMQFPLDMIWISASGTVVYIAPDVAPDTYPRAFVSTTSARYVLELPAGFVREYTVQVGDSVGL